MTPCVTIENMLTMNLQVKMSQGTSLCPHSASGSSSPSAFRVHEEGLKVGVELRHQRVHKVLDAGPSLQHACFTQKKKQKNTTTGL